MRMCLSVMVFNRHAFLICSSWRSAVFIFQMSHEIECCAFGAIGMSTYGRQPAWKGEALGRHLFYNYMRTFYAALLYRYDTCECVFI